MHVSLLTVPLIRIIPPIINFSKTFEFIAPESFQPRKIHANVINSQLLLEKVSGTNGPYIFSQCFGWDINLQGVPNGKTRSPFESKKRWSNIVPGQLFRGRCVLFPYSLVIGLIAYLLRCVGLGLFGRYEKGENLASVEAEISVSVTSVMGCRVAMCSHICLCTHPRLRWRGTKNVKKAALFVKYRFYKCRDLCLEGKSARGPWNLTRRFVRFSIFRDLWWIECWRLNELSLGVRNCFLSGVSWETFSNRFDIFSSGKLSWVYLWNLKKFDKNFIIKSKFNSSFRILWLFHWFFLYNIVTKFTCNKYARIHHVY